MTDPVSPLVAGAISAGFSLGKDAFIAVLKTLNSKLKQQGKPALDERKVKTFAETAHTYISDVRMVRTFWQTKKSVDLFDFFCVPHIIFDGKRKKAASLEDMSTAESLAILGVAGQGKTILMRRIFCIEAMKCERVPIFLELRYITAKKTLRASILDSLQKFGVNINDESLLDAILNTGMLVLFLDGFDEVAETDKQGVLTDIGNISRTYKNTQIIVSSRPNNGMEFLPQFKNVPISEIIGNEYQQYIEKICEDRELGGRLVEAINSADMYQGILQSPISIALLVFTYKSYQELPENISDFYEGLWHLMIRHHDGSKPQFHRPRKTKISDGEIRKCLDDLSYTLLRTKKSVYSEALIQSTFVKSCNLLGHSGQSENILDDIVSITCLILREGSEYRYVHKTVQEYFAATFVKEKPDIVAYKFYAACINHPYTGQWDQVLAFLSEIDKFRYLRDYLIPLHELRLQMSSSEILNHDSTRLEKSIIAQIKDLHFLFVSTGPGSSTCGIAKVTGANHHLARALNRKANAPNLPNDCKINNIPIVHPSEVVEKSNVNAEYMKKDAIAVKVMDLYQNNTLLVKDIIYEIMSEYVNSAKAAIKYIKEVENRSIPDPFDIR